MLSLYRAIAESWIAGFVSGKATGCLVVPLMMVVVAPLAGYTTMQFWNWYVVPLCGFREMGMGTAFGLGAFLALMQSLPPINHNQTVNETTYEFAINTIAKYGVAWATAGLIHLFS